MENNVAETRDTCELCQEQGINAKANDKRYCHNAFNESKTTLCELIQKREKINSSMPSNTTLTSTINKQFQPERK